MKERGILFSAPLVRALLAGTKTQTRRLIKPQPVHCDERIEHYDEVNADVRYPPGWRWPRLFVADESPVSFAQHLAEHCPYGPVGRRLWVRETWGFDSGVRADFKPAGRYDLSGMDLLSHTLYRADVTSLAPKPARWRPSLLMPRWASRLTLEVTEVRVQRLQDISEEDARAEGVVPQEWVDADAPFRTHRAAFELLWDEINGKRAAWASNPWLWCVSFKRVEGK